MVGKSASGRHSAPGIKLAVVFTLLLLGTEVWGQVFVVGREKPQGIPDFKQKPITKATREQLIASFAAEQGFAMRPLPMGTPGMVLHANGSLNFGNGDYYDGLVRKGVSSQPGDRIAITNFRIEGKTIIFDFNGGPDRKHKYLRHVSIGTNPYYTNPVVQDDGMTPTGSRLILTFDKFVPDLSPDDVRLLIQPVLDFSVKSPMQAYADTLPPKLKQAILDHQALVGMNRKMVTYALGSPDQKVREKTGDMPYEEWIYGAMPKPVQFVRFNGDRVIRIETAQYGRTPVIRAKDETDGYLSPRDVHTIAEGDAVASANGERSPSAAPTLRLPGEAAPPTAMAPVHNPTDPVKPSPLPSPPGQQILR
jgi:hypothetical protein